ncbi:MAG: DNA-directed RNA polymerase subunit beta' [Clostridia bacterium]|nr:DNA-directed RNA polymerase subunit beta' [Clostridia bacterium]
MERNDFYSIKIGLASPEMIREWSYGEVNKPETINYRTLKPEVGGLFCERIFGPTKDGACQCGKYKNSRSKEVIRCEKCGVDVTTKKVRRERMGHIELASPVSHIWYFKAVPSKMALALDMSPKALEQVLYFAQNVVLDPGYVSELKRGQVLTEKEYTEAREYYGDAFRVGMGAEAIKELLQSIDVEELSASLKEELKKASGQKKTRIIKRLEVIEAFRRSGNHLDWMILDVIPVIPPDIRPMVQLDGGRFASSDLNELYRRVISRNNRLKKLMEIRTPEIVVRNEKRMLQEAVDALIDNGKRGKPVTGPSNRALKSLSEMLRGKQGRFRQNLLGKRVDYSGRSVIVVGPNLKIYQCGLPKEMAIELFKPFVIKRLVEMGKATNVKDAQKKIDRAYDPANACVWDALENVIKEHPVLLNRAPTLHRLSIQAFEPILVEGRAIKLHPLVCPAFNADFDGDQMPVHVPLSAEAQAEARFLMLSANNLLKPMDGKAVTVPSQDMILGAYYLTMEKDGEPGEGGRFRDFNEAMCAYRNGVLGLHAKIFVRVEKEIDGEKKSAVINTTLGRLIYNQVIPQNLGFVDRTKPENAFKLEVEFVIKKKQLGQIIDRCIRNNGPTVCATMLDDIKALGYQYSTRASFSISVYDMTIPKEKPALISEAQKQVDELNNYYHMGLFSEEERYSAVIKLWDKTTNDVTNALQDCFSQFNPIKIMSDSGARGSIAQMRQLAGMRGLMFATNGRTIEVPIKSNFREGLSVIDYFMGAKGSRKSLSDTALRTADSGYLTRRLVDVSQDVIVREVKCDTQKGAWVSAVVDERENNILEPLSDRIIGRFTMGPVVDPKTGEVILEDDQMIDDAAAEKIEAAGIDKVCIRTVIQCHAKFGICAHCYGADLANGKLVNVGEAVGIIAAQSIGEPGTQLTMRTFHSGGVAGSDITQGLPRVEELFEARQPKKAAVISRVAGIAHISTTENGIHEVTVYPDDAQQSEQKYALNYGAKLAITEGQHLELGDAISEGNKAPADIMEVLGLDAVYEYLIKEIQKVYRSQSCNVNDKHVEIIARQMTRKLRITESGDTSLLPGSVVDVMELERANKELEKRTEAGEGNFAPAVGETILLGITKASLQNESFLSAASFQETTKVLTEAAIQGKVDYLMGPKENVIIGKLIPAGTGMACYKGVDVHPVNAEPDEDAV